MKIFKLLELDHNCKSPKTLSFNLGDSFLYENNSIYKRIRDLSFENGYTFTQEVSTQYQSLPLSQLNDILISKKIPYFDNVSVLKEVEKKIPQTTVWDEVVDNLKNNHVFHESCHAVARSAAQNYFNQQKFNSEFVLQILIEESFANSCELIGIVSVDQTAHRLFYENQSYIFMYDDKQLIQELVKDFGLYFIFSFTLFSYLFSNFMKSRIDEKELQQIFEITSKHDSNVKNLLKDPKQIKKLKVLIKIAFELNPRFRMVTTGFYLRLCGFTPKTQELLGFDFLNMIKTNLNYQDFIKKLVLQLL